MAASNTEVWQRGRIVESRALTPKIRRIVIEPSMPVKVAPGAHVDVRIRVAGEDDRRSYSIVDASADGRRIALSVLDSPRSRGGAAVMHGLREGDGIELTQPLVDFPLRIGARRYVLLAGGIGITAVSAMASTLAAVRSDYTLVYVGRSRSEMAYVSELQALHGDRLVLHVGDEGTPLDVSAFVGTIEDDTELYLCGPIRLMDAVRRAWVDAGLDAPNLRFETFGNSGWFEPQEFVVRVPALGLETTVGPNTSMLEALEAAGADMMYDCRKGECGLCEVLVLDLEGGIDHRDVFYSEREKNATAKMCCCVSRVVTQGATPVVTIQTT
jgi:vanillate monooxygenase ferredoxin subunit